jgi:hypothetical protein
MPVWAQVLGWIFLFWIVAFFAIWNLRWPTWARLATMGVIAVVLIAAVVSGGGGSSSRSADSGATSSSNAGNSTSGSTTSAPPSKPGNDDQVKGIVEDGGTFTYRSSDCTAQTCTVDAKIGTTLFGSEHEVVEPMFPVFKGLFGLKPYRRVTINAYGDVTTVGGKSQVAKVLTESCSHSANAQIDWDNINMDGIHALCNEFRFVKFST